MFRFFNSTVRQFVINNPPVLYIAHVWEISDSRRVLELVTYSGRGWMHVHRFIFSPKCIKAPRTSNHAAATATDTALISQLHDTKIVSSEMNKLMN